MDIQTLPVPTIKFETFPGNPTYLKLETNFNVSEEFANSMFENVQGLSLKKGDGNYFKSKLDGPYKVDFFFTNTLWCCDSITADITKLISDHLVLTLGRSDLKVLQTTVHGTAGLVTWKFAGVTWSTHEPVNINKLAAAANRLERPRNTFKERFKARK
jgi:hypothetical protein